MPQLMKKFLTLSILLFLGVTVYSQQAPKLSFNVAKRLANPELSQKPIALLLKGDPIRIKEIVLQQGGVFKYSKGNISSVMVPMHAITALANESGISRIEEGAPLLKPLLDDTMRYLNNIMPVHNGNLPLTKSYTGKNIVMGIIDTGIDFTHPDFRDSLGQTRIKYIWDHLLPDSANTPLPYNYGQEFTESDINNGLANAHHDQGVHGTVISGIAAGNGLAVGEYVGAAPDAELIIVNVNFNVSDDQFLSSVADGVDYIYNKAAAMGLPCVINISAGTYFGSHDGKDLSSQLIDNLITAQNGRSLVCAAGNAGGYPLHVQTTLNTGDTLFTWLNSPTQIYGEFWGDSLTMNNISFTIVADRTNPLYEYRGQLPYTNMSQQLGVLHEDTLFSINGNRLGIITSYGDKIGDQYGMYYVIDQDSFYNWRMQVTGTGTIDGYSFNWVPTASIPTSVIFPPVDYYRFPDNAQNMCSGFQCSDKTITVAQFTNMNSYHDYNNVIQTFPYTVGALHPTSSKGPTRDGRQKPDIAASGAYIFGPLIVTSQPWFKVNAPYKIPPTAQHLRGDGTSAASAVVSGVVALYLEKYPFASWLDIKNAVTTCAKTDAFTGTNLPDADWGFGKVDAFSMLTNCGLTSINHYEPGNSYIYCSPNPASGQVEFSFPVLKVAGQLIITDSQGRLVGSSLLSEGSDHFVLSRAKQLTSGIYFLKIISANETIAIGKLLYQ